MATARTFKLCAGFAGFYHTVHSHMGWVSTRSKAKHNAMASQANEGEPKYKVPQLLHPELLSLEDIRRILRDRCVAVNGLRSMDKEHLVAVLHRVAVPLPQRDCFRKSSTKRFTFSSNVDNKNLLHSSERASNSTKKRLSNCIDFDKKTIKLRKVVDSYGEEDSQKINSLKRHNVEKDATKTPISSSSDADTLIESPASKTSRVKISWP